MAKRKALNELNKRARNKSFSKILLNMLKSPKNECDHFKSDLGLIPWSWILKKSNSRLEIKSNAYLNWNSNNLNFKNSQNLGLTSTKSPRFYKNNWGFYKVP